MKTTGYMKSFLAAYAIAFLGIWQAGIAQADDFYSGKTIHFYIGYSPGGGYDQYSRLVARHIGKHIPGNPTVLPQNMPGAGGLLVANYMDKVAPRDGTALAMAAGSLAVEQALKGPGVEYDAAELNWIGMVTKTGALPVLYTWHNSETTTFEDARTRPTIVGAGSAGNTEYMPRVLNRLAGAQFEVISGYPGSSDILAAAERGEVEGGIMIWSDLRRLNMAEERRVNPIAVISAERIPDLPDVPTVVELGLTDEDKQVLRVLTAGEIGRSIFTTPGVPEERIEVLRQAFTSTFEDEEFIADATRAGLFYDGMWGAELQALVEEVIGSPEEITRKAAEARSH